MGSFSEDLKVNKFHLDEVCENHSNIYGQYSTDLAKAKLELNNAEDAVKLEMSEVDAAIRNAAEKKPSEAAITQMVYASEPVVKARQRVAQAKENEFLLQAQVRSFEHRKSMIDNLVVLWSKGYWATPDGGKTAESDRKGYRDQLNEGRDGN